MRSTFAALGLATLAAANSVPIKSPYPRYNAIRYTSTFDDISSAADLTNLDEVGPYNGLSYDGIGDVAFGVAGNIVLGVNARSPPSAGAYSPEFTLRAGVQPQLTAQYAGSVTNFFDFEEFYYGCAIAAVAGAAGVPAECKINVTGYKDSNVVARQSFNFQPGLALQTDMKKARLNKKFKGLDTVIFDTETGLTGAVTATLLDNIQYVAYSKKAKHAPKKHQPKKHHD